MNPNLRAYFKLEEASELLDIDVDTILQCAMQRKTFLSILLNKPSDYEEDLGLVEKDGETYKHTKTNRTQTFSFGEKSEIINLRYLHPEDVAKVYFNEAPNRVTIINRIFNTPDIDPKRGTALMHDNLRITKSSLTITPEQLIKFSKRHKLKIKKRLGVDAADRVTVSWLIRNVPIRMWISTAALFIAIFVAGTTFGQSPFFHKAQEAWKSISTPSAPLTSRSTPFAPLTGLAKATLLLAC
ncbi:hypothetical protein [Stutzerimonas nitrititolerans]|uniref:hypothetical protein n=1 Tax=Stutzerimonas nitrititolerans TaxID=2482751 RepID=UPI0028A8AEE6|nr:hypothetical protein [Stutzerimonas nitrititolerans]